MNPRIKKCSDCLVEKPTTEFYGRAASFDGVSWVCKTCSKIKSDIYRHTKKGLINGIYRNQIKSSIRRGHPLPSYTKAELFCWVQNQKAFDCLYLNWLNSGFNKMKIPSIDRNNDYLPYTIDNLLRVSTWQENYDRGHRDRKNGVNNKQNIAVVQITRSGVFVKKYYSRTFASRITGVNRGNIYACCTKRRKTAGGYRWAYA